MAAELPSAAALAVASLALRETRRDRARRRAAAAVKKAAPPAAPPVPASPQRAGEWDGNVHIRSGGGDAG